MGAGALELPEALRRKIALFRSGARIFRDADELFAEVAWLQVMVGQGIRPRTHHPQAELPDANQLDGFLTDLRALIAQSVRCLPMHADYLREHCAAPVQADIRSG